MKETDSLTSPRSVPGRAVLETCVEMDRARDGGPVTMPMAVVWGLGAPSAGDEINIVEKCTKNVPTKNHLIKQRIFFYKILSVPEQKPRRLYIEMGPKTKKCK